MKKVRVVLVILCITLFLSSCGSMHLTNFTFIGWHNESLNSASGGFNYFIGQKDKSMKVSEGESVNVIIELEVNKGEMYATVVDSDGNELFITTTSDTFTYTADNDTVLTATVHAQKAGGGYKINFEKTENEKEDMTEL